MNNILNNGQQSEIGQKEVTLKKPVPQPRVEHHSGELQHLHKTVSAPRVVTATIDKPLIHAQPRSAPSTRSKYAWSLAHIASIGQSMRSQPSLNMTEFAQAVVDDNPTVAAEFANEIFEDEEKKDEGR